MSKKRRFASPAEIKVHGSLMNGYFVGPKTCFDTSIPGVARWMDKGAPGERGEGERQLGRGRKSHGGGMTGVRCRGSGIERRKDSHVCGAFID